MPKKAATQPVKAAWVAKKASSPALKAVRMAKKAPSMALTAALLEEKAPAPALETVSAARKASLMARTTYGCRKIVALSEPVRNLFSVLKMRPSFPRKREPSVVVFHWLKTLGSRFRGNDEQKRPSREIFEQALISCRISSHVLLSRRWVCSWAH